MEATLCSLYPSASKARIEPFFSFLKTFLFNSFGMVNSFFFIPIAFELFLALFLLQEDSDDHSSVFYTFPR